jgi:hypothetical protein
MANRKNLSVKALLKIDAFIFEIETPDGPMTEKCVLNGGKVIA